MFVTTSYPSRPDDAAGHFVQAEARAEAARGSAVTVLAPGAHQGSAADANPRVVWLRDGGAFGWPGAMARIAERPSRLVGALGYALRARRALVRLGPFDRVVAHFIVPSGWPVASGCPAPLEVVAHGSDVRLLLRIPPGLRRFILGTLCGRGARFRFVSAELRDLLCEVGPSGLRDRSEVIPCPIEMPVEASRSEARAQLGIGEDEPVALVVGRLVPSKRVEVALSALTLVGTMRVVVVGDGPLRQALTARFPAATLLGQLGRQETLLWIAAADVLVTASLQEGASTVVREAEALGTPVVSAAGDCRSFLNPAWGQLPWPDRPDAESL